MPFKREFLPNAEQLLDRAAIKETKEKIESFVNRCTLHPWHIITDNDLVLLMQACNVRYALPP